VRRHSRAAALFLLLAGCDGSSDDDPLLPPPAAPTGLTATAVTTERIDLAWTDNATDEVDYRVGQSVDLVTWVPIATLPAGSTSHVVRGLSPGTTYHFRVAAANSTTLSPWAGPATAATPQRAWIAPTVVNGAPSARTEHTAIYDALYQRMIVFGGADGSPFQNDVWQLDLSAAGSVTWTPLFPTVNLPATAPPSPRWQHSAIYDSAYQRMIVFGGNDGAESGEVWALSLPDPGGATAPAWTLLAPTVNLPATGPPAARSNHSAVYDAANDRMILFGGFDGTNALSDVWSLSLPDPSGPTPIPAWTPLSPTLTPPATQAPVSQSHSAVYDDGNQRMIVFGGNDGTTNSAQVWTLTLPGSGSGAWTLLGPASPPSARRDHAAIFDGANLRMTVHGGDDGSPVGDVWVLKPAGGTSWELFVPVVTPPATSPPSARSGHTAVFDAANGRMVIFGGDEGGLTLVDDVWLLRL
jgi:hypothetical protein